MKQGPLILLQSLTCKHCETELRYDFWLSAWVDDLRRTGVHEKRPAEWSDETPIVTGHTHEINLDAYLEKEIKDVQGL